MKEIRIPVRWFDLDAFLKKTIDYLRCNSLQSSTPPLQWLPSNGLEAIRVLGLRITGFLDPEGFFRCV